MLACFFFDMDDPSGTAAKGKRYMDDHYTGVKYGWGMIPEKPFGKNFKKKTKKW